MELIGCGGDKSRSTDWLQLRGWRKRSVLVGLLTGSDLCTAIGRCTGDTGLPFTTGEEGLSLGDLVPLEVGGMPLGERLCLASLSLWRKFLPSTWCILTACMCVRVHMFVSVYVCNMHVCAYVSVYVCVYVTSCVCVCMCVCACVYVYVCLCICLCVYVSVCKYVSGLHVNLGTYAAFDIKK